MCMNVRVNVCAVMCVYLCVCAHGCEGVDSHVCMNVSMSVCAQLRESICVCVHMTGCTLCILTRFSLEAAPVVTGMGRHQILPQ